MKQNDLLKKTKEMVGAIISAIIMIYVIISGLALATAVNVIIRNYLIPSLLVAGSIVLSMYIIKLIAERA